MSEGQNISYGGKSLHVVEAVVGEFIKSFFESAWGEVVPYCFPLPFAPEPSPKSTSTPISEITPELHTVEDPTPPKDSSLPRGVCF